MNARIARLALSLVSLATLAACGTERTPSSGGDPFATPFGYWEGKGTFAITDMKDDYRHMERTAKFELWFNVRDEGEVTGEVEILYDANLTVKNLPQSTGLVTFAPEIGGKVTDPDPSRRYPLEGRYADGGMVLKALIADDAAPIMFTYRATAGLGIDVTGGQVAVGGGGTEMVNAGEISEEMPMTPFDPFVAAGEVMKRPNGPHVARHESRTEKRSVQWTATQVNPTR